MKPDPPTPRQKVTAWLRAAAVLDDASWRWPSDSGQPIDAVDRHIHDVIVPFLRRRAAGIQDTHTTRLIARGRRRSR